MARDAVDQRVGGRFGGRVAVCAKAEAEPASTPATAASFRVCLMSVMSMRSIPTFASAATAAATRATTAATSPPPPPRRRCAAVDPPATGAGASRAAAPGSTAGTLRSRLARGTAIDLRLGLRAARALSALSRSPTAHSSARHRDRRFAPCRAASTVRALGPVAALRHSRSALRLGRALSPVPPIFVRFLAPDLSRAPDLQVVQPSRGWRPRGSASRPSSSRRARLRPCPDTARGCRLILVVEVLPRRVAAPIGRGAAVSRIVIPRVAVCC